MHVDVCRNALPVSGDKFWENVTLSDFTTTGCNSIVT